VDCIYETFSAKIIFQLNIKITVLNAYTFICFIWWNLSLKKLLSTWSDRVGLVGKMELESTMLKMLSEIETRFGQISQEKELKWVSYVKILILNKEELF
jgi:hypothetical protein